MASTDNGPFSMSTISDALQHIPFSKGISGHIPTPGFARRPSYAVADTCSNSLFNVMTSGQGLSQFKDIISKSDRKELQLMASLLTSDSDYFMEVVRNIYGSRRVQKLLGISDDVDTFFCAAILRRFFHIMTDKYASYVAIRAMLVFDQKKKYVMYKHLLHHALDIARNQYGCIALNEVITDADDPFYRNLLLDLVARNAVCLSNDPSGNFVVQHVLTLYDLRCTHNVCVSLRGHCVDLSFKKYGSYIVEKLLDNEEAMAVVVVELLECDGDRLMRLARNEFGSFVVVKALRLTQVMKRVDLFRSLVQKLMPFRHLLVRSHGSNIANILESAV
ncbi:Pumilio-like protein 18 [Raphanus sativus]|uniref:Pumilio homolog 18-like n=1 Tax=Raphanus sativus TaxID=3726 RepID=A0A6J0L0X7_RAPSA|nr:pumilio homolog 18-like [Raphanus sativus]KAJ4875120.1 Pumilio-like protein 18 [Raphanus sativus]